MRAELSGRQDWLGAVWAGDTASAEAIGYLLWAATSYAVESLEQQISDKDDGKK